MEPICARVLEILADLERAGAGTELDEFSLAVALELAPAATPPYAYTISPVRGQLLRVLAALDAHKWIYATKNGFWRLRLTAAGRRALAEAHAAPTEGAATESEDRALELAEQPMPVPALDATPAWEWPRTAQARVEPYRDRLTGVALAIALCGAMLVFVFTTLVQGPLAQQAAAQRDAPVVAAPPPAALPVAVDAEPTAPPAGAPTATAPAPPVASPAAPAQRAYVVANTDGAGVYLRRTPQLHDRLTAWPDATRLEEIGPPVNAGGLTWHHVRAPDGTAGYVPAQYTSEAR